MLVSKINRRIIGVAVTSPIALLLLSLITIGGCGKVESPTAPQKVSLEEGILSDNYPEMSKGTISTDDVAGVTWSSSVFVPKTGGTAFIYFKNNGPGALTFVAPSSWSVKGTALSSGQINLTPKGSTAYFSDHGWGGLQHQGWSFTGAITFNNISLSRGKQATAHMEMSFVRAGTTYTLPVNVHFK